jgi:hypothetical protein
MGAEGAPGMDLPPRIGKRIWAIPGTANSRARMAVVNLMDCNASVPCTYEGKYVIMSRIPAYNADLIPNRTA